MIARISTLGLLLLTASLQAQEGCTGRPASPVLTVELPGHPFGIAETADGCSIFVSMAPGSGKGSGIAVLRRQAGRVELARVVNLQSLGIVLSHDGKLLIATGDDRVSFLDVERLISGRADPTLGWFSDGPRRQSIWANVTSDDRLLFVSEESAAEITVIDLRRARASGFHADAIIGKIPTGHAPIALVFSPDEKWLFSTSQVAMKEWNWPAACKPEGRPNVTEAVNAEGAVLVIDVAKAATDPSNAVAKRVPAGCSPVRLARSPSGDRIYVTARNSNAVIAFETAKLLADPEHARLGMAKVGTAPVPVAVLDGGKTVVAGNSNRFGGANANESLTLLDASKFGQTGDAEIGMIPAGAFPRDLRLSADGSTLYLANFGSSSLQVMDVARLRSK
ncbi:MAG TPA: hypothetical protein VMH81_29765 [Bryobacteraceae bacterium]|nr:hypothetical protein [Bryobacteraceae bacterium]